MELQNLKETVEKVKDAERDLELSVNQKISEIQLGITEIKVMLQERVDKENLKNEILAKDIETHENRIKKIEENETWLWRTVVGAILTTVIAAIIFVIQLMK